MNLVRLHTPVNILMTCHLVNKEARPILERKTARCRLQPLRYLVDFSAAWALVEPLGLLRSCLGLPNESISRWEPKAVKKFLQGCRFYLSQTRQTQNGRQGVQTIEMTINHKSGITYGREVIQTMTWVGQVKDYQDSPTQLVVIYKSPLPRFWQRGNTQIEEPDDLEESFLQEIPREPEQGDQTSPQHGVFVRPLKEEAFEKHLEVLELY